MSATRRGGWRVALACGELWKLVPSIASGDSLASWSDARELAQKYADAGERARIVDPDGEQSADVPASKKSARRGAAWRVPM